MIASFIRAIRPAATATLVCCLGTAFAENSGADMVASPAPAAAARVDAAVAAVVNGTSITENEVNREVDMAVRQMEGQLPPEQLATMRSHIRNSVLESLVMRQVLLDQAEKVGITVGDDDYQRAVDEMTHTIQPGKTLKDMLDAYGISEEDFRSKVTTGIRIQKLLESQAGKAATVSEEEIRAFYKGHPEHFGEPETVTARHILVGFEPGATDEAKAAARAKLMSVRKKLMEGASFEEMAKEHSACPSQARGGSLGRFPRGSMAPEFEEAAFSQPIGEIGKIVETQFGFHLIRVDARAEAQMTPIEEAKGKIAAFLKDQKEEAASRAYVEKLRGDAVITYPNRPANAGEG